MPPAWRRFHGRGGRAAHPPPRTLAVVTKSVIVRRARVRDRLVVIVSPTVVARSVFQTVSVGEMPRPPTNRPMQPTGPPAAGSRLSTRIFRSRLSGGTASEAPLRCACDAVAPPPATDGPGVRPIIEEEVVDGSGGALWPSWVGDRCCQGDGGFTLWTGSPSRRAVPLPAPSP